jgi:ABC-type transport system involved in cytochrome bd biosynthesis fused ATPase/permease subunit
MIARYDPLLRLLRLALGSRPLRGRLLLAVAAGAAATGCGVALLAVSGFLLARASQHPGILAISAAVVAVRALSAGRGVSRYLERLASHDAAFRVLARVRVRIYRRLERLAPAGLAEFSSGDLLARLVSDVDATQDLFIRGIAAPLAAAVVGAGSVVACLLILAPAGAVLAAGLLVAGIAVPVLAARAARGAARRVAPARGQLAASLTDLMAGAAELHAYGARETALASVTVADADLTRQADRNAMVSGLSAGLSSVTAGLTVWGVLLLGVAATGGGALTRVPLAVLTLTALASFEAVTDLARRGGPARPGPRVGPPDRGAAGRAGPGARAARAAATARRPDIGQAARRSGPLPARWPGRPRRHRPRSACRGGGSP